MSSPIWPEKELDKLVDVDPEILSSGTDKNYRFAYIDIGSVKPNLVSDQLENYTFQFSPSRARKKVIRGDVLMATVRPNLKSFAKIKKSGEFVASTGFAVLRAKDKISSNDYIKHLIFSDEITRQVDSLIAGSNYPAISIGNIKKLKVKAPPYEEQVRIAKILDSFDDQIESISILIDKKRLIKKGLLSELLEKHSQNNEKPIFLRELLYGVRGVSYTPNQLLVENTKDSFTLLRSNNIKNNCINFDSIQLVPKKLVSDAQKVEPGDIAVCMSNGSKSLVGKSAAFSEDVRGLNLTIGAFCSIFKPLDRRDASFLAHLFQSSIYQKYIDIVLAGSAINNLQNKVIEELRIPCIHNVARYEIGKFLDSLDCELSSIIREYEKLKLQKKGLMQDLFTGQVRVN